MVFCGKKMSLIITDIRMPGHNGFDIAREARKLKADIPVVFMTSFEILPSEFGRLFPSLTGITLLKKPFPLKTLVETVKAIEQAR
jgi:DNA-binding response OmpR family regulator